MHFPSYLFHSCDVEKCQEQNVQTKSTTLQSLFKISTNKIHIETTILPSFQSNENNHLKRKEVISHLGSKYSIVVI